MSDPLFDTLFRPTTLSPVVASAPPVRERGTRTRAGNAMNRTRAALLAGAARAVESSGTKITMAQVAAEAGVAKATLYNHFRTREAGLAGLLAAEVEALVTAAAGQPPAPALVEAAAAISDHPVRRALQRLEPGVLAALGRIDPAADGWQRARAAVADALGPQSRSGTDLVLRWLASFLLTPADRVTIVAQVAALLAGLPENDSAARPA
ncbi:MAG TPA: TetR family transcriptional regulator [Jatrophihabitans sp.]|nr:TetR family transcriptional regulator [Jatrophihabitans sp.]